MFRISAWDSLKKFTFDIKKNNIPLRSQYPLSPQRFPAPDLKITEH